MKCKIWISDLTKNYKVVGIKLGILTDTFTALQYNADFNAETITFFYFVGDFDTLVSG